MKMKGYRVQPNCFLLLIFVTSKHRNEARGKYPLGREKQWVSARHLFGFSPILSYWARIEQTAVGYLLGFCCENVVGLYVPPTGCRPMSMLGRFCSLGREVCQLQREKICFYRVTGGAIACSSVVACPPLRGGPRQ